MCIEGAYNLKKSELESSRLWTEEYIVFLADEVYFAGHRFPQGIARVRVGLLVYTSSWRVFRSQSEEVQVSGARVGLDVFE